MFSQHCVLYIRHNYVVVLSIVLDGNVDTEEGSLHFIVVRSLNDNERGEEDL